MREIDRSQANDGRPKSDSECAPPSQEGAGKPTLLQLSGSILGAAFGVQSSKVHQRDFRQRSPAVFIIGGLVFGVLFVATLVLVVRAVLPD